MKKNSKKKQDNNDNMTLKEEITSYYRKPSYDGITRIVSQTELNTECITLQESKELILEKIKQHFH